jgi:CRISPR-associated protein Csd1
MPLNDLLALYERLKNIPYPGEKYATVDFYVDIDRQGNLVQVTDIREDIGNYKKGKVHFVPWRGSSTSNAAQISVPCFGSFKYLTKDNYYDNFKTLHSQLIIDDVAFYAVRCFLEKKLEKDIYIEFSGEKKIETKYFLFRCIEEEPESRLVYLRPQVRDTWLNYYKNEICSSLPDGTSALTGKKGKISLRHGPQVSNGGGSGAPLVSFNMDSLNYLGKKEGLNFPCRVDEVNKYSLAYEYLQRNKQKVSIGKTSVLFWTDSSSEEEKSIQDLFGFTMKEDQDYALIEKARKAFMSAKKGRPVAVNDKNNIHILEVHNKIGRISIKNYKIQSLDRFLFCLGKHFSDCRIETKFNTDFDLTLTRILYCTLKSKKEKLENVPKELNTRTLSAIIEGRPYPNLLYDRVLACLKIPDDITYTRMCVLKGFYKRRQEKISVNLDKGHPKTEYHLGRLLYVFDHLMKKAQNSKKGVADSYFKSARTTPNKIFPALCDKAQHHLEKLEKNNSGGLRVWFERHIQEILGQVGAFPKTINKTNEGYFLLGFYHQMQDTYTKKENGDANE